MRVENDTNKLEESYNGYLKYLIGRMATCSGYDEQTRKEYIEELFELMEEAA